MEYKLNNEKRKNLLNSAKEKAINFVRIDERKLAKASFLNDCIKNNLYQKDFISNLIRYTKDEDVSELFFNDFN